MKVLLVEGEPHYSAWLADKLSQSGYRIEFCAANKAGGFEKRRSEISATIVDLSCSQSDPSSIVRSLRERGNDSPMIVIHDRENWREKVHSLDAGADDFLVKPVRSEEVSARIRALVRRSAGQNSNLIECDGIELCLKQKYAKLNGKLMDLTRSEFVLLRQLLLWPDQTHSPERIAEALGKGRESFSSNAVEVLVTRLRKKIGREKIRTVRRVGYRFQLSEGVGFETPGILEKKAL